MVLNRVNSHTLSAQKEKKWGTESKIQKNMTYPMVDVNDWSRRAAGEDNMSSAYRKLSFAPLAEGTMRQQTQSVFLEREEVYLNREEFPVVGSLLPFEVVPVYKDHSMKIQDKQPMHSSTEDQIRASNHDSRPPLACRNNAADLEAQKIANLEPMAPALDNSQVTRFLQSMQAVVTDVNLFDFEMAQSLNADTLDTLVSGKFTEDAEVDLPVTGELEEYSTVELGAAYSVDDTDEEPVKGPRHATSYSFELAKQSPTAPPSISIAETGKPDPTEVGAAEPVDQGALVKGVALDGTGPTVAFWDMDSKGSLGLNFVFMDDFPNFANILDDVGKRQNSCALLERFSDLEAWSNVDPNSISLNSMIMASIGSFTGKEIVVAQPPCVESGGVVASSLMEKALSRVDTQSAAAFCEFQQLNQQHSVENASGEEEIDAKSKESVFDREEKHKRAKTCSTNILGLESSSAVRKESLERFLRVKSISLPVDERVLAEATFQAEVDGSIPAAFQAVTNRSSASFNETDACAGSDEVYYYNNQLYSGDLLQLSIGHSDEHDQSGMQLHSLPANKSKKFRLESQHGGSGSDNESSPCGSHRCVQPTAQVLDSHSSMMQQHMRPKNSPKAKASKGSRDSFRSCSEYQSVRKCQQAGSGSSRTFDTFGSSDFASARGSWGRKASARVLDSFESTDLGGIREPRSRIRAVGSDPYAATEVNCLKEDQGSGRCRSRRAWRGSLGTQLSPSSEYDVTRRKARSAARMFRSIQDTARRDPLEETTTTSVDTKSIEGWEQGHKRRSGTRSFERGATWHGMWRRHSEHRGTRSFEQGHVQKRDSWFSIFATSRLFRRSHFQATEVVQNTARDFSPCHSAKNESYLTRLKGRKKWKMHRSNSLGNAFGKLFSCFRL